jgi:LysR family cys regulon transcriptional activator
MNLHQLRFVREAVRQNYNLTDAAKSLFTSQPGVSKAIIELEEELGVDIFTRHGKRIRGLTEPGRLVLQSVELIMQEIESLKRIGKEYAAHDSGSFTIATTHTQARYMLPKVVQAFMQKYPKVRLSLLQGNPKQIADMVKSDQADLAIATEAITTIDGLITLPAYQWEHVVVAPPEHPLFKSRAISLELGMGIGIIAGMAFDAERDRGLRAIPVGHLFGMNTSRVAIKQGAYLRSYVYTFIELLTPTLNRKMVESAMRGGDNYEL